VVWISALAMGGGKIENNPTHAWPFFFFGIDSYRLVEIGQWLTR